MHFKLKFVVIFFISTHIGNISKYLEKERSYLAELEKQKTKLDWTNRTIEIGLQLVANVQDEHHSSTLMGKVCFQTCSV